MLKEIKLKEFERGGLSIRPSKIKLSKNMNLYRFIAYDPYEPENDFGSYSYKEKNYEAALKKFKKDLWP